MKQNQSDDLPSLGFEKHKLDSDKDSVLKPESEKQDPFGNESQAGVKYKTMAWCGILTILGVGIISTYTAYTIGQFKCRHVQVHSMADAGDILMGRLGRCTLDVAQLIFFVLVMGSHVLTFSIMMNVLTEHRSCTIIFSAVGLLASFMLTLPRRLERLSHISSVSFVSIVGAVVTGMIGVTLVRDGPVHVPAFSPSPKVHDACLAIANIIFAYAGHVAFFTLFSELKELKDFPKALALLQMSEMVLYTVAAIVIYAYIGPTVNSPALNSAGHLFRKISYAIAIPTVRVFPRTSSDMS
ncbi:Amino acid transporter transmembrane [Penicillium cf. griseofulvum]|nr:Amino acid transporter transmembrane [Penicillium cf. griseofulvum]